MLVAWTGIETALRIRPLVVSFRIAMAIVVANWRHLRHVDAFKTGKYLLHTSQHLIEGAVFKHQHNNMFDRIWHIGSVAELFCTRHVCTTNVSQGSFGAGRGSRTPKVLSTGGF